jgi:hypothetical protein
LEKFENRDCSETCRAVQLLFSAFTNNDPVLSEQQREKIISHLNACSTCNELFEMDRRIVRIIQDNWANDAAITQESADEIAGMTSEAGWQALLRQCPELARDYHRQLHLKQVRAQRFRFAKVGAIAAGLLIALAIGWQSIMGRSSPSNPIVERPVPPENSVATTLEGNWRFSSSQAAFQSPALNLDPADYVSWREENRAWFAQTYPWIFKIQESLATRDIHADYIDILMASGDLGQFQYVPANGVRQPLALPDRKAIARCAEHFGVAADWLESRCAAGAATASIEPGPAFKLWQNDVSSALSNKEGIPTEQLMVDLRVSDYLANTRAAAYLWLKLHPEKWIANNPQLAALLNRPQPEPQSLNSDLSVLARQIVAARKIRHISGELLSRSSDTKCVPAPKPFVDELAASLAELIPAAHPREKH